MVDLSLDFTNPLQARKWIKLLRNSKVSGISIEGDLDLSVDYMGFSFSSNKLGLRGPSNQNSGNVIFGTSYAMGFSVNNGLNWWDLALKSDDWLNLGLPVGPWQVGNMLDNYLQAKRKVALVIYHPNFWGLSRQYKKLYDKQGEATKLFGWKTDWWSCVKLKYKKDRLLKRQIGTGRYVAFRNAEIDYKINCLYTYFNFEKHEELAKDVIEQWERNLNGFEKVIFVRAPIKEEQVPEKFKNDTLRKTQESYEEGWKRMKEKFSETGAVFHHPSGFTLEDYYPKDTHWRPAGNNKFAQQLEDILDKEL